MKAVDNVVAIAPPVTPAAANDAPALVMPGHFKKALLKSTWKDLLDSTVATLHTKENRFTFEFAATLMAKFRAGETMTATESKELKRLLGVLGLARDEDGDGQGKKKGKLGRYITPG